MSAAPGADKMSAVPVRLGPPSSGRPYLRLLFQHASPNLCPL